MSNFLLSFLLNVLDEPQTYCLASENKYHQSVSTLVYHIPNNTPYLPSADAWASPGASVVSVAELQLGSVAAPARWEGGGGRLGQSAAGRGTGAANRGPPCCRRGNWGTTGGTPCPDGAMTTPAPRGESYPWPPPRHPPQVTLPKVVALATGVTKIYRIMLYNSLTNISWAAPAKCSMEKAENSSHCNTTKHFLIAKSYLIYLVGNIWSYGTWPALKPKQFFSSEAFSQALCWRLGKVHKLDDMTQIRLFNQWITGINESKTVHNKLQLLNVYAFKIDLKFKMLIAF